MNPGRCFAEQVGVNAPGNANNTIFFPLNKSSVFTGCGVPSFICINVAEGTLSPTLIVINLSCVRPRPSTLARVLGKPTRLACCHSGNGMISCAMASKEHRRTIGGDNFLEG